MEGGFAHVLGFLGAQYVQYTAPWGVRVSPLSAMRLRAHG